MFCQNSQAVYILWRLCCRHILSIFPRLERLRWQLFFDFRNHPQIFSYSVIPIEILVLERVSLCWSSKHFGQSTKPLYTSQNRVETSWKKIARFLQFARSRSRFLWLFLTKVVLCRNVHSRVLNVFKSIGYTRQNKTVFAERKIV
jgi:hypothetical protein